MKIAILGAGSSYTPELIEGIIQKQKTLPIEEIFLVDIPEGKEKLSIIKSLTERMLKKYSLKIKIRETFEKEKAIENADFILTQFRIGGLKAREKDEKIPLKLGVIGQETTGAGGFANALRTIPVMLELCKLIEKLSPKSFLINFSNPSGMITEAILKYSSVRAIGLCNVPINMIYDIASKLKCNPEDLWCRFVGLNHLSFITEVKFNGKDVMKSLIKVKQGQIVKNIKTIDNIEKVASIINGIPSPYLQYFYFKNEMLDEEIEKYSKTNKTRATEVMEIEKSLFEKYKDENLDHKPEELSQRGGSRYSMVAISLLESIYNNKNDIHVVNVKNNGAISDLPSDCVIETNSIVGKNGAFPISYGELPIQIRGLIQQVKYYEILTIQAAVEGNYEKALLALLNNPLVGDLNTAKKLLDKILKENKKFLPQFFK